ncbi:MAG: zinc-dependent metalloprotease, partial [Pyrinomonadaceae bacterium]
ADPMDVRYNMITWVHRSTRGWAYGTNIVDPRTGEIIKGNVTLDSQRARQDYLIGTGLIPPYQGGNSAAGSGTFGAACGFAMLPDIDYLLSAEPSTDSAAMSLARIRQLSAHEVGHTLGIGHNYYSSEAGRISVMDYPHPLVTLRPDGTLDHSQ